MKSLAATLLLLFGTALAEDDLAALVRDLGSDDFATRDAATRRLTEIGEPARAMLEEARSAPDAEVQMRATRILATLDAREQIDGEYRAAREALAGDTPEDAARRVWLEVLYLVARREEAKLDQHFASGQAPAGLWGSARDCPLSALVDLTWIDVIPATRVSWLDSEIGPDDVLVMAAGPRESADPESVPESYVKEPRVLVMRPTGSGWKVCVVPESHQLGGWDFHAPQSVRQRREWEAGALNLEIVWSRHDGVSLYGLAQALDGVGDFEGAIRAFERCQPTGQWPDYCIVHRYFDLMRLGRRNDAARVLAEEPGAGSCEYLAKVITWLRHDMKTEALVAYAADQGSYEAESIYYYLGMERLLAGDIDAAKAHLTRCVEKGGGCYEQTFAEDALWLLNEPEERATESGEGH